MSSLRRLVVVSHVVHYRWQGQLYAYGPYSREIDLWADLFPEVVIASPCRQSRPAGDCLPFTRRNIEIAPTLETGGDHLSDKLKQLWLLPILVLQLARTMWRADALHVRCPGNLGLLGTLLGPALMRYRVAKYAGQWNGYPGEGWTNRLQRWLLSSRWWNSPVTVYGQWPNQPPHVHAFFTSMMSRDQVARAVAVAERKTITSPVRVLFSGRLAPEKRVSTLLDGIDLARQRGVQLEVVILGEGPLRAELEQQVARLNLEPVVQFVGSLPYDEALTWNEWAHCLVLPSQHSEGWPKVIAEGMCYGVICLGVAHGQVPYMLRERGILLETGTAAEIAEALQYVEHHASDLAPLIQAASLWARNYSMEGLQTALSRLLAREWRVTLETPATDRQPIFSDTLLGEKA